jgi:L-threonylcarbamoyladenylate synthase
MSVATQIFAPNEAGIAAAAALLRAGRLVAFPTETVYGLGGDALNPAAVAAIFAAKGRPAHDPLIVHLADLAILPRAPGLPPAVTSGGDTVAVRVPAHPLAQRLLAAAGTPVAAPSANRFGHTSPTTAQHVLADLSGRIDGLIDGGPATIGVESTVLDLTGPTPTLLRPGGVSLEELRALLGEVAVGGRGAGPLRSPGLLDRHYAPDSALWLAVGPPEAARAWLRARAAAEIAAGRRVGLLIPNDDIAALADLGADIEPLGASSAPAAVAGRLYAALRALDARRPDLILARDFGDHGIARAITDRLIRAASGRVVML